MIQSDLYILGDSDSQLCSQMPKPLSSAKVQAPLDKETKGSAILKKDST